MRSRICWLAAGLLLLSACGSVPEEEGGPSAGYADSQPSATQQQQRPDRGVSTAVGVAQPGTQEDLVASIGDRVFFGFDRYDLAPEARQKVQAWADWLQRYSGLSVTIEGHTDERGTREYNLALGERRAISVRDYLTALGVSPSRMRTVSYGKERPAVVGSNEAAWAQNRRAVLVVE